jgi:hypothetical protein
MATESRGGEVGDSRRQPREASLLQVLAAIFLARHGRCGWGGQRKSRGTDFDKFSSRARRRSRAVSDRRATAVWEGLADVVQNRIAGTRSGLGVNRGAWSSRVVGAGKRCVLRYHDGTEVEAFCEPLNADPAAPASGRAMRSAKGSTPLGRKTTSPRPRLPALTPHLRHDPRSNLPAVGRASRRGAWAGFRLAVQRRLPP